MIVSFGGFGKKHGFEVKEIVLEKIQQNEA